MASWGIFFLPAFKWVQGGVRLAPSHTPKMSLLLYTVYIDWWVVVVSLYGLKHLETVQKQQVLFCVPWTVPSQGGNLQEKAGSGRPITFYLAGTRKSIWMTSIWDDWLIDICFIGMAYNHQPAMNL